MMAIDYLEHCCKPSVHARFRVIGQTVKMISSDKNVA